MIARFFFGICMLALLSSCHSGSKAKYSLEDFRAERTTKENREEFLLIEREKLFERLDQPISAEVESDWGGAFWTAGLINERGPAVRRAIEAGLNEFETLSPDFQRIILQSVYTLYPGEYTERVKELAEVVKEPKPFAIACAYVLDDDNSIDTRGDLNGLMLSKFDQWWTDGRLMMLSLRLGGDREPSLPPLDELLNKSCEGKAVVFSFQRKDRRYPGRVVVRDRAGKFVTDGNGQVLTIPQLAMSRTNMPGTITYGNSPEGIYVITESGVATNKFIGPTPYLYSKVPYEASMKEFFFGKSEEEWTLDAYLELLPESWRKYWPIYESYYAGVAGRSDMLCHGTTINPELYRGEIYYPYTPSAGCLCTDERWSEVTGELVKSDQITLLNAFYRAGDGTGYLIVVDLPGDGVVEEAEILELVGSL